MIVLESRIGIACTAGAVGAPSMASPLTTRPSVLRTRARGRSSSIATSSLRPQQSLQAGRYHHVRTGRNGQRTFGVPREFDLVLASKFRNHLAVDSFVPLPAAFVLLHASGSVLVFDVACYYPRKSLEEDWPARGQRECGRRAHSAETCHWQRTTIAAMPRIRVCILANQETSAVQTVDISKMPSFY